MLANRPPSKRQALYRILAADNAPGDFRHRRFGPIALTKAVMVLLAEAWPQTVSIPDLAVAASRLTGEPPDPEGLSHILLSTYSARVVDLHTQSRHCVAPVSQ